MGEDIKNIRKYLGFSQCAVSYACGWGTNYISHIENGEIKNISFKNAYKIAFFFLEQLKKKQITANDLEEVIGSSPLLDLIHTLETKNRCDYEFYYS